LFQSCSHTRVRPRRSTLGDVRVSSPVALHDQVPINASGERVHPVQPPSPSSAPASVISSAASPPPAPFTRTARAVSTLTSLRQEYHSRPRHSESARAFLVSSWPLALRTVSDAGAGAAASRLTRTSRHTDVPPGAAAGRAPAAANHG